MAIKIQSETTGSSSIVMNLVINMGDYIDDGQVVYQTQRYSLNDMEVLREENTLILQPKNNSDSKLYLKGTAATYDKFQTLQQKQLIFTTLKFISEIEGGKVQRRLILGEEGPFDLLFQIFEIKYLFIGPIILFLIAHYTYIRRETECFKLRYELYFLRN